MMPLKSITSVTSERDGFAWRLSAIAPGDTVEFRGDRDTIDQAKQLLHDLAAGSHRHNSPQRHSRRPPPRRPPRRVWPTNS